MDVAISTPDSFTKPRGGSNPWGSTNKDPMSNAYARMPALLGSLFDASESAKGFARRKRNFRQFFAQSLSEPRTEARAASFWPS